MGFCYKEDEDGYLEVKDECIDCEHSYTDELDPMGLYCDQKNCVKG